MTSKQTKEIRTPRAGSKQAKLVAMLSRKNGITLSKASETLKWQKHTTSAAMTGLRKRGYKIDRVDRDKKENIYVIRSEIDAAN